MEAINRSEGPKVQGIARNMSKLVHKDKLTCETQQVKNKPRVHTHMLSNQFHNLGLELCTKCEQNTTQ